MLYVHQHIRQSVGRYIYQRAVEGLPLDKLTRTFFLCTLLRLSSLGEVFYTMMAILFILFATLAMDISHCRG